MARVRRSALVLAAASALLNATAGAALADHVRVVAEVMVEHAPKAEQGYLVEVKMRTSEGRPLNDATVAFYEKVELFGAREMLIGTARTDGQGFGEILYLPARTGSHEIVVRFSGREHVLPLELRHVFDATVAAVPYEVATPPLAAFSARVPYGVGLVVLSVWALIAFAFFGTLIRIRRGARDQQQHA